MAHVLHHKTDKQDLRGVVKDTLNDGPTGIQIQVKEVADVKGLKADSPHTPTMTKGMVDRIQTEKNMASSGRRLIVGCDGNSQTNSTKIHVTFAETR
jgi:hypothetical protein